MVWLYMPWLQQTANTIDKSDCSLNRNREITESWTNRINCSRIDDNFSRIRVFPFYLKLKATLMLPVNIDVEKPDRYISNTYAIIRWYDAEKSQFHKWIKISVQIQMGKKKRETKNLFWLHINVNWHGAANFSFFFTTGCSHMNSIFF